MCSESSVNPRELYLRTVLKSFGLKKVESEFLNCDGVGKGLGDKCIVTRTPSLVTGLHTLHHAILHVRKICTSKYLLRMQRARVKWIYVCYCLRRPL